jgi:hypothetical protein
MKTDAYTKAILTIIAACLMWMCLNGVTPVTQAQVKPPEPAPVILVDAKGNPIFTAEGLRVNFGPKPLPVILTNDAVPVNVRNPALPVVLRAVQRSTMWDAIHVQVMREPPTQMPIP